MAGVPLSSVEADCRLVVLSGRRCSRRCGKEAQLVLLPVERVCELQTRLACSCSGSSSPTSWKRGSPLAPVVVVGEGQVNLGFRPAVVAMAKVSKALWLIDFDEPNQSPPVTTVTVVVSGLA